MASVPLKASDMGLLESNTRCPSAASITHYKNCHNKWIIAIAAELCFISLEFKYHLSLHPPWTSCISVAAKVNVCLSKSGMLMADNQWHHLLNEISQSVHGDSLESL